MNYSFLLNSSASLPKKIDAIDFVNSYCNQLLNHNRLLLYVCFSMIFINTIILNVVWWIDKRYKEVNNKSIFRIGYLDKNKNWSYGWESFEAFQIWLYRFSLTWICIALGVVILNNGGFEWLLTIIHYFI